jgi:hypothetical protein
LQALPQNLPSETCAHAESPRFLPCKDTILNIPTAKQIVLSVNGLFKEFNAEFEITNEASGAGRGVVGMVYVW